jgi:PHD/YefM family antitoxin component YafN of YafNO toxin-antitoxin module
MLRKYRSPGVMIVKPSSVIRSDYKSFSRLCHESDDPIIVTNNGENDLVVMSHEAFCRREAWIRLQVKLASADKQIVEGNLIDHDEVFSRLKDHIHGKL